jgi:hypothetical protein
MTKLFTCDFIKAWIGPCPTSVTKEGERCIKHSNIKCCSCGSLATHECDEMCECTRCVCGSPLCDNCEHTIYEDGTNGGIGFNAQRPPEGMKTHCEKKHQIYAPWYMREDNR